ncbi:NUDIX domain-containing protein [Streptomyces sp. NPDC052107]|uniref:NUDIX domain-containing protein n=1 Tax=Streptomyces sp. NPDC052107 TaxID=3155632 RepID=UPI003445A562
MAMPAHLARLRERIGHDLIVLPAVAACVFDEDGRLLLARHDYDEWGLPGGGVKPDQPPLEAVVEQAAEEVGLNVRPVGVIGVYGGPECRSTYRNGDQVSYVISVYGCVLESGTPRPDEDEVSAVDFFGREDIDRLKLMAWMPGVLDDLFTWYAQRSR